MSSWHITSSCFHGFRCVFAQLISLIKQRVQKKIRLNEIARLTRAFCNLGRLFNVLVQSGAFAARKKVTAMSKAINK